MAVKLQQMEELGEFEGMSHREKSKKLEELKKNGIKDTARTERIDEV